MPKAKRIELSEQVINDKGAPRFQIGNLLGRGGFGVTHLGRDLKLGKEVVIKAESSDERVQLLRMEYEVYKSLHYAKSPTEVPKVYKFLVNYQVECHVDGAAAKTLLSCNLLAMDRLGLDLEGCASFAKVRHKHKTKKSHYCMHIHTVCQCLVQLFRQCANLHGSNWIHRDIKPANIMFGREAQKHTLFLIDFGLAKQYRVKGQLAPERYSSEKGIGTDGYQSQFLVDRMNRATRRDDLISAMYTLLHYYLPLPWLDGKVYNEDEKVNFRREYTKALTIANSTLGSLLKQLESLRWDEEPNYAHYEAQLCRYIDRLVEDEYYDMFEWLDDYDNIVLYKSSHPTLSITAIAKTFYNSS